MYIKSFSQKQNYLNYAFKTKKISINNLDIPIFFILSQINCCLFNIMSSSKKNLYGDFNLKTIFEKV